MARTPKKTVIITLIFSLVMFAITFAMVPLYNVLCRNIGLNGKVDLTPVALTYQDPDKSREITVQFVTTNNQNLPWQFYPVKNHLRAHPGENIQVMFFAKNLSAKTMLVQAIPSIAPWQAAKYFHKIECFCFTKQTLAAHAERNMPVIFRIEKDLPANIKTITLSYTLFNMDKTKKDFT